MLSDTSLATGILVYSSHACQYRAEFQPLITSVTPSIGRYQVGTAPAIRKYPTCDSVGRSVDPSLNQSTACPPLFMRWSRTLAKTIAVYWHKRYRQNVLSPQLQKRRVIRPIRN